jgi:hypothetical protein
MTDEERIGKLEKEIRNFNLVLAGANVQGGFPDLEKKESNADRIAQIRMAHEKFAVSGGDRTSVEGNLTTGLAINFKCPPVADTGTGQVPPSGGGPPTGACCIGESCSITTEADCSSGGGTYQGNGTACDPNPCLTDGACCHPDGSCFQSNAAGCDGTWRGAGTSCFTFGICFGACCHPNGTCDEMSADTCAASPGLVEFHGIGTTCDSFVCGGACCYCGGCGFFNASLCSDSGGGWHAGQSCEEGCPTGCCCQYLDGVFNSCASTPEAQCSSTCCDPPCPGWTFIWHPDPNDCIGCSGLIGCGPL